MSAEIRRIFINTFGWITVLCTKEKVFPLSTNHLLEVYLHCILASKAVNTHFQYIDTCYTIVLKIIIEAWGKATTSDYSKNLLMKYLITVLKCYCTSICLHPQTHNYVKEDTMVTDLLRKHWQIKLPFLRAAITLGFKSNWSQSISRYSTEANYVIKVAFIRYTCKKKK